MTILESNQLILQKIDAEQDNLILGFIPVSEDEAQQILSSVREEIRSVYSPWSLMHRYPAAMAFACCHGPSREIQERSDFWEILEQCIGVRISINERSAVSEKFRAACRRIGVIDGTLPHTGTPHIAPFYFQAGIWFQWIESLRAGLRSTLRETIATDASTSEEFQKFSRILAGKVHGQRRLVQFLESDGGPLLVSRILRSYLLGDYTGLPYHLREPVRSSFESQGDAFFIRSPYLSLNRKSDSLEIVLPAQTRSTSDSNTFWQANDQRYSARHETRMPVNAGSSEAIEIELKGLVKGLNDHTFSVDYTIDAETPYRCFNSRGREVEIGNPVNGTLKPGEYGIVVHPDADLGLDSDLFPILPGGIRFCSFFSFRPGDDPLSIKIANQDFTLTCQKVSGIFCSGDNNSTIELIGQKPLRFGPQAGFDAYLAGDNETDVELTLSSTDSSDDLVTRIPIRAIDGQAIAEPGQLDQSFASFSENLTSGIHEISFLINEASSRCSLSFLYWKGLQTIDECRGFVCSRPTNIDLRRSKGLGTWRDQHLPFDCAGHTPLVEISADGLSEPLKIPRPGIRAFLREPDSEALEPVELGHPVIADSRDPRVLEVHSGGFQKWRVFNNDLLLKTLTGRQRIGSRTLSGLAALSENGGRVWAEAEDGTKVELFSLVSPFTSSAPRMRTNHGTQEETWSFSLPAEDLHELALQVTDYSESPESKVENVSIWRDGPTLEAPILLEDRDILTEVEYIETSRPPRLKVRLSYKVESLTDAFLLIDVLRRDRFVATFAPIQCPEDFGYSNLRLVLQGPLRPVNHSDIWRCVAQARPTDHPAMAERSSADPSVQSLGSLFSASLSAIRGLLSFKYPSEVWKEVAHRFTRSPKILAERARALQLPDYVKEWWKQSALEVSEFSLSRRAAVERFFLFGGHPRALEYRNLEPLDDFADRSRTLQSLYLSAEIDCFPSLANFVQEKLTNLIPIKPALAFEGGPDVVQGTKKKFGRFRFEEFFSKDYSIQTVQIVEDRDFRRDSMLFTPCHAAEALHSLNRRTRPLFNVAQEDSGSPLKTAIRGIEKAAQRLDTCAPKLSRNLGLKIGFPTHRHEEEFRQWWVPDCMENPIAENIMGLLWFMVGYTRLAAFDRISSQECSEMLQGLFPEEHRFDVSRGINTLLSFGPELFAFYTGLFDFALFEDQ